MTFTKFIKQLLFSIATVGLLMTCNTGEKQSSNNTAQTASETAEAQNNEQEFKDAPDFTLETMQGDTFTLSDQQGKVVVLNFWATWCAPCRKEIPDFMEMHEALNEDSVLFAGILLMKKGGTKYDPMPKIWA